MKTIQISGKKYYIFSFEPDWSSDVVFELRFDTVINRNKIFSEQRRPMLASPFRTVQANFLVYGSDAQKLANNLREISQSRVLMPIFTEPVRPSAPVTDEIFCNTNLDYYYNLNNYAEYMIGIDYSVGISEANEIDSISGDPTNRIDFTASWTETFPLNSSVFFPAFSARIENSIEIESLSSEVMRTQIRAKEIRP